MILEARASNCFTSTHVVKVNGQAIGKFEGHLLDEGLDLSLTGLRRLRLEHSGIFCSKFILQDVASEEVFGEATPGRLFTTAWDLQLSCGACVFERPSFFSSEYELHHEDTKIFRASRVGMCERGWYVESLIADEPPIYDMLLTGLIFHVILSRQQRTAAVSSA